MIKNYQNPSFVIYFRVGGVISFFQAGTVLCPRMSAFVCQACYGTRHDPTKGDFQGERKYEGKRRNNRGGIDDPRS